MPFSQAIRKGRSRIVQNFRTVSSVERSFYGQQTGAMLDLFLRENAISCWMKICATNPKPR